MRSIARRCAPDRGRRRHGLDRVGIRGCTRLGRDLGIDGACVIGQFHRRRDWLKREGENRERQHDARVDGPRDGLAARDVFVTANAGDPAGPCYWGGIEVRGHRAGAGIALAGIYLFCGIVRAAAAPASPLRRPLDGAVPTSVPASEPISEATAGAQPRVTELTRASPPKSEPADPLALQRGRYIPGKGFAFATVDKRFSLVIRARIQPRFELEHPNAPRGSTEDVFQLRRARLQLQGNLFGIHNKYYIQFGFTPRDMTGGLIVGDGSPRRNPLRDARLEFDYLRDFTIWVGQTKVPFSRQRVISDGNLSAIDRSIANEEFNLDRDVGVQALSKDLGGLGGRLGYNLGVFMGEGRNTFQLTDPGMLYVARVDVRPLGSFDDEVESDLGRSRKVGLGIGTAYAFHDNAQGNRGVHGERWADEGTADYHNVTVDAVLKWRGLAIESAFHWRRGIHRKNGGAVDSLDMPIPTELARNGLGWFGQIAWLVPRIPLELVGRYGLVRNTFGSGSGLGRADEAGGGLNYYLAGHNFKIQADYYRLWDDSLASSFDVSARRGTDRIRLQIQLGF